MKLKTNNNPEKILIMWPSDLKRSSNQNINIPTEKQTKDTNRQFTKEVYINRQHTCKKCLTSPKITEMQNQIKKRYIF